MLAMDMVVHGDPIIEQKQVLERTKNNSYTWYILLCIMRFDTYCQDPS